MAFEKWAEAEDQVRKILWKREAQNELNHTVAEL